MMECHTIARANTAYLSSYCSDKRVPWVLCPKQNLNLGNLDRLKSASYSNQVFNGRQSNCHIYWKTFHMRVSLKEEGSSPQAANNSYQVHGDQVEEEVLSQPSSSAELRTLMADTERAKLINKLSEANRHNRFLKRQLLEKDDALVNFKSDLAVLNYEIQTLVSLAEEISRSPIAQGSRKINGKYIQSHILLRLQAVYKKMKEQIKDVDVVKSKEVPIFWSGMAESVQVMGSFDGWSQGEHLSSEFTGSYMKFQTTLVLRPGRYEIKFLVDGEWHLSPEFPIVGEGSMENNLLVVE